MPSSPSFYQCSVRELARDDSSTAEGRDPKKGEGRRGWDDAKLCSPQPFQQKDMANNHKWVKVLHKKGEDCSEMGWGPKLSITGTG